MMPTPEEQKQIMKRVELEDDLKKLKSMIIAAMAIAFGAGFIAGAVLV
jgi:hypothetical protein